MTNRQLLSTRESGRSTERIGRINSQRKTPVNMNRRETSKFGSKVVDKNGNGDERIPRFGSIKKNGNNSSFEKGK